MKIAVLGTGMVGNAIASKLVVLGHDVTMGSRTADNVKAAAWTQAVGPRGRAGTFADAAVFGELVFNCTHGANSLAALSAAGNTVNCDVMVNPQKLPGSHTVFLSGNDPGAKRIVRELLQAFGWMDAIDLGDIATARATEGYLPLCSIASTICQFPCGASAMATR
jgi:predicted dinucleotide-binding enzyme